ncbi:hypothetical protein FKG94_28365, partial [Exilibacterium tricleocarpae]
MADRIRNEPNTSSTGSGSSSPAQASTPDPESVAQWQQASENTSQQSSDVDSSDEGFTLSVVSDIQEQEQEALAGPSQEPAASALNNDNEADTEIRMSELLEADRERHLAIMGDLRSVIMDIADGDESVREIAQRLNQSAMRHEEALQEFINREGNDGRTPDNFRYRGRDLMLAGHELEVDTDRSLNMTDFRNQIREARPRGARNANSVELEVYRRQLQNISAYIDIFRGGISLPADIRAEVDDMMHRFEQDVSGPFVRLIELTTERDNSIRQLRSATFNALQHSMRFSTLDMNRAFDLGKWQGRIQDAPQAGDLYQELEMHRGAIQEVRDATAYMGENFGLSDEVYHLALDLANTAEFHRGQASRYTEERTGASGDMYNRIEHHLAEIDNLRNFISNQLELSLSADSSPPDNDAWNLFNIGEFMLRNSDSVDTHLDPNRHLAAIRQMHNYVAFIADNPVAPDNLRREAINILNSERGIQGEIPGRLLAHEQALDAPVNSVQPLPDDFYETTLNLGERINHLQDNFQRHLGGEPYLPVYRADSEDPPPLPPYTRSDLPSYSPPPSYTETESSPLDDAPRSRSGSNEYPESSNQADRSSPTEAPVEPSHRPGPSDTHDIGTSPHAEEGRVSQGDAADTGVDGAGNNNPRIMRVEIDPEITSRGVQQGVLDLNARKSGEKKPGQSGTDPVLPVPPPAYPEALAVPPAYT